MKERDYLSRALVSVTTLDGGDANEYAIQQRLPKGYILEGRLFVFPAGYWESYRINGKDYNGCGDRPLAEQRELAVKDLEQAGFSTQEANEYITGLVIKEGVPHHLSYEASIKWLQAHPEAETEARRVLNEAKNQLQTEINSTPKRTFSRR